MEPWRDRMSVWGGTIYNIIKIPHSLI